MVMDPKAAAVSALFRASDMHGVDSPEYKAALEQFMKLEEEQERKRFGETICEIVAKMNLTCPMKEK